MEKLELVLFELLLKQSKVFFIQSAFILGGAIYIEEHIGKQIIVIRLQNNDLGN